LSAPTGKAAARLKQAIDGALVELKSQVGSSLDLDTLVQRVGPARTLHSLLGARPDTRHFAYNAGRPLDLDVLIVDEASMVHLEMMAALLDALPAHTRLILLGDKDQLASVEAGAVLGDLCRDARAGKYSPETAAFLTEVAGEIIPDDYLETQSAPTLAQQTTMLRQSRRFGGPIGQLATAVNEGTAPAAVALLHEGMAKDGDASEIAFQEGGAAAQIVSLALHGRGGSASYSAYAHELSRWPELERLEGLKDAHAEWVKDVLKAFDRFRLLCAVRDGDWGVSGLNSAVEKALERNRHIRRAGEWYLGRPVMVTRNDAALGVFNGDIGIALPSVGDGHSLRVYFLQGEQLRSVGVTRLAHVETAFAMTVHKSQGSEFEHSAVILSAAAGGILGRELVYTGITRARKTFTLLAERPGLLEQAIASPTKRASGLPRFLDREFAVGPEAR
jgi:exodeoxyribonuclease V alpha subunit